jgi:prepilin-type N-terminal cleavage/methylation domain-containing protein
MAMRRGFTLTEMLVATIVFLVGFVAVFGLFLAGMRFRKLAEDTTRASLAASCLIDEIRLDAGGGMTGAPKQPQDYVGDGFADVAAGGLEEGSADSSAPNDPLFAYRSVPGVWYRVMKATDLNGSGTNARTTVLHLKLLVVPFATSDNPLTFATLNSRLGLVRTGPGGNGPVDLNATPTAVADALVQRGIGFHYQVVITRRPSWMP